MNTPKYPNRYALREALDIYLEAMSPFVSKYLDVDIKKEEIEEKDIAHYIRADWEYTFKEQFKVRERYGKFHYYEARTVTSLIVEGRNRVSHERLRELDPRFTQAQLFFIAEILGKIDALDAQREVETIRDKLVDKAEDHIKKIAQERLVEALSSTELEEITVESLTASVEGISKAAAGKLVAALKRHVALNQTAKSRKKREPKPSIADRYVPETTEKDHNNIAIQVVELRINATGSKPSWRSIREKLGLKNNQFHKVIRHSAGYRKAVIDRIKSLKAQEGGWEYSGKLEVLTGIDDISEDELK